MIKYGFFHLPPPMHGSAKIGETIKNNFNLIDVLDISLMDSISNHGSLTLNKIKKILYQITFVLFTRFNSEKIIYIPSSKGLSLIRDFFLIFILVLKKVKVYSLYLNTKADESSFLLRILHKFIIKNSHVILTSEVFISDLLGVKPKQLSICNLGVNCPEYMITHQNLSKVVNIGFFSNWYISKGIDDFIKIINIVNKVNNNFHFYIAGQTGDLNKNDIITQLSRTDNVTIVGPVYNDFKFEFLSSLDFLSFPSKDDTFPLSILEAMSQGVFTISTNVGAIDEILKNPLAGICLDGSEYITSVIDILNSNLLVNKNQIIKEYKLRYTEKKFIDNLSKIFSK